MNFAYDNYFRVTSESINNANPISFTYDGDGLLTGAGSLTMTRHAQNGYVTAKTLASTATSFSYDQYGGMTSRSDSYNGSQFMKQDFSLDNSGRIIGKTETSGVTTKAHTYSYDQTGRLTDVEVDGVNAAHYGYDANANRIAYMAPGVSITATYDVQDRLLTYGNNTYAYTLNGELKTKTNATGVTNYTYDAFGSLTKVVLPDGTVLEYITDSSGRRIAKKVNGAIVKAWLYEGSLRPIAELDSTGNVVSRFVYATNVNVPEYMIKAGVTYRIITDQLGSVRMVVNATTGAVAQEMRYDEFGVVVLDTNPGFVPFGFAGGLYDVDTKLVRFGARDYDAETGRWTAKDPIGFNGGDTNLYGYVLADPVNGVDVRGLTVEDMMRWLHEEFTNHKAAWVPGNLCNEFVYDAFAASGASDFPTELRKSGGKPVVSDLADPMKYLDSLTYSRDLSDLRKGDLIIWYGKVREDGTSLVHHVGIYVGNKMVIYQNDKYGVKRQTIEYVTKNSMNAQPIVRRYVGHWW